ncbi:alpha/beta hydrolase [Caulobacter sp. 73W]|uniref:Proline iminopeptidase n=1 Tax=Caulobacter sp. 73W TaxID=3161137 RepID=A0AB39KS86_9CAUL
MAGAAVGQPAQAPQPSAEAREAAYGIVRPMIADMGKISTPTGIETVETVRLGGMDQWISIRGMARENPVLIYVHGGPGASEMGRSWPYQRGWEDYFTVVQWDQRGTGKTLRLNGAKATEPTLSRKRMAEDLIELIAHVRMRTGHDKVILLGHSWGNAIAMDAALAHPEWISAYVGVGPLLEMRKSEAAVYEHVLRIAAERNDEVALKELRSIAPYPGKGDIPIASLGLVRKWVGIYGGLAAYRDNANFYFRAARVSPYFDLAERQAIDEGGLLSVTKLISELSDADMAGVRSVSFPTFMFVGRHDLTTPPEVTTAWLQRLKAPAKEVVWFEHSAHLAPHEEPGRFLVSLVQTVRPHAMVGQKNTRAKAPSRRAPVRP